MDKKTIIIECAICDDARQDQSGKTMLWGMYNGSIIFQNAPKGEAANGLHNLIFCVSIAGAVGKYEVFWDVINPSGTSIRPDPVNSLNVDFQPNQILLLQLAPALFAEYGDYRFTLKAGDQIDYQKPFQVLVNEDASTNRLVSEEA